MAFERESAKKVINIKKSSRDFLAQRNRSWSTTSTTTQLVKVEET